GLASPVPVRAARGMGADLVIAVYISNNPRFGKTRDSVELMLQTFAIMGQSIAGYELNEADIVIRPETGKIRSTGFEDRHLAIIEGERAGLAAIAAIKQKIAEKTVAVPVSR
ncbi:MAG: patatin-like phospholipase family protein, partial [Burkholderiales bacterium]